MFDVMLKTMAREKIYNFLCEMYYNCFYLKPIPFLEYKFGFLVEFPFRKCILLIG